MHVELVSPEAVLFEGDAEMVVARTVGGGDIAFMEGHVPFIGELDVARVEVIAADGSRTTIAVHRGFVEMSGKHVTIISDVAEIEDEIDVARAEDARSRAQQAVSANAEDAEAMAALRRAEVRLSVAQGGAAA